MEDGFFMSPEGKWSAPLPFRQGRIRLDNNRVQAVQRTENLARNLKRNPIKQEKICSFMEDMFTKGHAEIAPPIQEGEECRYLPIFPVYHPQKPGKVRVVFDSSAKFNGHSLNDVLMTGPDVTNNLVGVLLNFRKEKIAITADIEQMFFNFQVHEQHRNFLRFLWFEENDPTKNLVDYRMRVHVFGNSPSPAVATMGLRKSACNHGNDESCDQVCDFVRNHFYVDDSLRSFSDEKTAVELMLKTQQRLKENGNLRLHKISSNRAEVLSCFPRDDLAKELSESDFFDSNTAGVQRSLGLSWELKSDTFLYRVSIGEKPCTKRGILSTINSIFDPLGFIAPVLLGGRLILRNAIKDNTVTWDEELPEDVQNDWNEWKGSLKDLESLRIPRTFTDMSLEGSVRRELHMFSDASKEAIGAVGYLKVYDIHGNYNLGFVLGKSKVAPKHGHTIPRLELCVAVLSVELSEFITRYLAVTIDATYFYTDSQVILRYVNNKTRRFHVYVGNRVARILRASACPQWNYVPTNRNPADQATRPEKASDLHKGNGSWLQGPVEFLDEKTEKKTYEIVDPDQDKEVHSQVNVLKTAVTKKGLGNHRFERFSSWKRLILAISRLKQKAASLQGNSSDERNVVDYYQEAELLVLKEVQREVYANELHCLQGNCPLPRNSSLVTLSPVLDSDGLIRLGGRLKKSTLETGEKTQNY